jgi:hypothetical protein
MSARFSWVALVLVALPGCSIDRGLRKDLSPRVRAAIEDFPGRYEGLETEGILEAQAMERDFAGLMKRLSRDNDRGGPHGAAHRVNDALEHELWALLKRFANYPGSGRMILAAVDEIYLGYRSNGNWGWWWHWPYLNCFKAMLLAERLEVSHPALAEEALWTRIYCHRVNGLRGTKNGESLESEAMESQYFWTADPIKVKALCESYLERHPKGKYLARVRNLLEMKDVTLTLPGHPVGGMVEPSDDATSFSTQEYDGPRFIIDRGGK